MPNKWSTSDMMSILFILLYLAGVVYNMYSGQVVYVVIWSILLLLNLGLFIYRKVKKEDKNGN